MRINKSITSNLMKRIFLIYAKFATFFFYLFLFGTLSFGRAFSAIHINTPLTPLFITEIFILSNIPLLLYRFKDLAKLPIAFSAPLYVFFLYGCYLLFNGVACRNILALRDITLCGYILFLPIAFIHCDTLKKIGVLMPVVIMSNIVNLFLCWCLFTETYFSNAFFRDLIQCKARVFNWGLYYGISISFIIAFYEHIKAKTHRMLVLVLLALNISMITVTSQRALWVATILLGIFFYVILKRKFLKTHFILAPVIVLICGAAFCSYFKIAPPSLMDKFLNKSKSSILFFQGVPYEYQVKNEPMCKSFLGNVNWRFNIWRQTLKFCSDAHLAGKGFGKYPIYEIWGTQQYPHGINLDSGMVPAHNHIVTVFFKMGIVGLALFMYINAYVVMYVLSYLRRCATIFIKSLLIALLGAFVFWHALALFFDVIDSPPTSIFLWIIMGMIFAAIKIDNNLLNDSKTGRI